jgi:hypothetical protein
LDVILYCTGQVNRTPSNQWGALLFALHSEPCLLAQNHCELQHDWSMAFRIILFIHFYPLTPNGCGIHIWMMNEFKHVSWIEGFVVSIHPNL